MEDALSNSERKVPRLGEMLVGRGLLRAAELEAGLSYQASHGGRLGAVLLRMGSITADSLFPVLGEQLGLEVIRGASLDESQLRAGLEALAHHGRWLLDRQILPWQDESGRWHLASADPLQADLQESVADIAACQGGVWHLMPESEVLQWQHRLQQTELSSQALDVRALRELAEDAPVISLVNNLVAQAVEARASDIHLEPGEREFEVRFRIDGVLHVRQAIGMDRYPAVASRVKLIAGTDIAERRLPQDGRISMRAAGAEIDVRVSSIPAVFGESIVMRLLPKRRTDLTLERLGMRPAQLDTFRQWLGMPNGLVLVTGPTGSGKSTTLYSALAATNDQTRKIVTVEDPVEFRLPHVIQVQAQPDIGYTFARALRAFLRHDPDVIMIGEIRDRETAEIAIQSALTGHLVLATLHTNDAPSAITRLVDMGVEPFLVAAALRAVLAQRLVRRLCDACAQPAKAPAALASQALELALRDAARDGMELDDLPRWRKPMGCPACERTGFRGRVGIYEMLDLGPELQHAVAQREPMDKILSLAGQQGRRSLAQEGVLKVASGITTLDEVLRATGGSAVD